MRESDYPSYRKRPVVIQAVQFNGQNHGEVRRFMGINDESRVPWIIGVLPIDTLEGTMTATAGDYIIRGVQGEFYPCKPDIFLATYEAVHSTRESDGST